MRCVLWSALSAGLAGCLCLGLALSPAMSGESLWVEGELPQSHTMNRHPWWYDQVIREHLSGGDWISNFSEEKEGTASYLLSLREGGNYALWLRANPVKSHLAFRVDGGDWQEVSFDAAAEVTNIAADGKPDLRFIAWVFAGRLSLAPGEHRITFRMYGEPQNHGGLDAFVLTNEAFVPRGLSRPGDPATQAERVDETETWAFQPPPDPFSSEAWLDLRSLNEAQAGESGFVKLSADGMSFLRGDGQPIRFWSVVSDGWRMEPDAMRRHLRWLAKLGVNMVRVHAQLCVEKEGARLTDVDEKVLDGIHRFVAEAKKQGIYVTISPYWSHTQKIPASWGLESYTGQSGPEGLIFFEPRLQEAYKVWVKELYTRPNPYAENRTALRDEPAVAVIQVQNEDSLLFWTSQRILEPFAGKLRRLFADFAVRKYGSLEAASKAWGKARHKDDNLTAGEVGLEIIWRFTSQAPKPDPDWAIRLADQLEFMARLQYGFYRDIAAYYRNDLGCKQLINATNWRTADPVLLEDAERWTYTAADVAAINRYTGGIHSGPMNGWRIDPNHFFAGRSNLLQPEDFPGAIKQTLEQPFLITEVSWTSPSLYQAEGPIMAAAYMSLTGVDSFYWFAFGDETWHTDPVWPYWKVGNLNSLKKWSSAIPTHAGMFPAAALAYRLGFIREADQPAVYEERSLRGMWERRVPIISEAGKFDPNRDQGDFAPNSPIRQEVDRLAFFVGPVVIKFDGDESKSRTVPLDRYIDRDRGVVTGMTGEITLDYRRGTLTVDSPRCQSWVGFLKAAGGKRELADIVVESQSDYAAITAVPLDQRPLAESEKILVQIGTTIRPTGWIERDAEIESDGVTLRGKQIVDTGRAPWRVAAAKVRLTVKNPNIKKATRLDVNGYPAGSIPVEGTVDGIAFDFPADAMYVVLSP